VSATERRRRRLRRPAPPATPAVTEPAEPVSPPRPTPHHIAELTGTFALTAAVHDPEPVEPPVPVEAPPPSGDETAAERGLRGLVGGGSSQVGVVAAMRARDAARPSDADLAAAERETVIVRRGWVPREELPRSGRR